MDFNTLLIYCLITFFAVVSPGPAVFLALTNGIVYDMKIVVSSSLGNILGLFILSSVSISGLGVILLASSTLFMIVKLIGAAYLVYLGIKQFKNASRLKLEKNKSGNLEKSLKKAFFESFFVAVTNPKPIIFFIALFPQFLDLNSAIVPQFLIMTGVFMFFSFITLCIYGYLAKKTRKLFKKESFLIWFHRLTGGIFIGLGLSLTQIKNSTN